MMTKLTCDEDGTLDKFLTEWEKVIKSGGYKPTEDNINEEFAMQLFWNGSYVFCTYWNN